VGFSIWGSGSAELPWGSCGSFVAGQVQGPPYNAFLHTFRRLGVSCQESGF